MNASVLPKINAKIFCFVQGAAFASAAQHGKPQWGFQVNVIRPGSGKQLLVLGEELCAQDACTGGRQAELFFQKTGEQRGVQVELLRSRQAQLDADGIALRRVGHLRDMLFELNDLVSLFAVLFHRALSSALYWSSTAAASAG